MRNGLAAILPTIDSTMAKRVSMQDRLRAACAADLLVKIDRPLLDAGLPAVTLGYVAKFNSHWVLMNVVDDGIRFDGFQALRTSDIVSIQVPAANAAFVEKALELRNESRPASDCIRLASLTELIASTASLFPLVTIHQEVHRPDQCDIGRFEAIEGESLILHGIDPEAHWHGSETKIPVANITRVDFGDSYAEALTLVNAAL